MLQSKKSDFKIEQDTSVVIDLLLWATEGSEFVAAWISPVAMSVNITAKNLLYTLQRSSHQYKWIIIVYVCLPYIQIQYSQMFKWKLFILFCELKASKLCKYL